MPKIEQTEIQDNAVTKVFATYQNKFSCTYICECGKRVNFTQHGRPERLMKCFDCQDTVKEL